jgi:predicted XRE-type DNA-binding protein
MENTQDDPDQRPPACAQSLVEERVTDDGADDGPIETANMRVRSDLIRAVQKAVDGWGLTQAAAARRLEVTQPRLNHLMRGRVRNFSLDALYVLAVRAGLDVRVHIEHEADAAPGGVERPQPTMTDA